MSRFSGQTGTERPRLRQEELSELLKRDDRRCVRYLLGTAGGFVMAVGAATLWPHPVVFVVAFLVVGALQHRLSIIHHEAVHYLLFTDRRWNEWIGRLVGYMIGFGMAYRLQHFAHHQKLGHGMDPDAANYLPYPLSPIAFVKDVVLHVSGMAAVRQFLTIARPALPVAGADRPKSELPWIALVQLCLVGLFAWIGPWWWYGALWLAPLLTVAKTLAHFRNVAEHLLVRPLTDPELSRLRTLRCSAMERFFFAPMHFNFHAEHHLYPSLPYFQLPKAHALLASDPAYAGAIHVADGYLCLLLTAGIKR